MKHVIFVLVLLCSCHLISGQLHYSSSRKDGGSESDNIRDLSFHSNLGVVSVGYFNGIANFGGDDLISAGWSDIFLAKYDSSLNHTWSKSFGNSEIDQGDAVSVASNGDIFISGSFKLDIDFGGENMGGCSVIQCSSFFLAKFAANGTFLFNQQYPMNSSSSTGIAPALAVSSNGSVIVLGGMFNPTISFGATTYTTEGSADGFLAVLDSAGNPQWSAAMQGSGGTEQFLDVVLDNAGNIAVVGTYSSASTSLAGYSLLSNSSRNAVVAKFYPGGNLMWHVEMSTAGDDKFEAVAVDSNGNVYAGGRCGGSYTIGMHYVACNVGASDLTLVKISAQGSPLWAFSYGSPDDEGIMDIVFDSLVYVTGFYGDNISLGGDLLTTGSSYSGFIAAYDSDGNYVWSGTAVDAFITRLIYDTTSGRIGIGGSPGGSFTVVGGPTYGNSGYADVFIATFQTDPSPSPSPSASPSSWSSSGPTSNSPPASSDSDSGVASWTVGLIVGIVVAVVVVVIAASMIAMLILFKRREAKRRIDHELHDMENNRPEVKSNEIDYLEIEIGKELGRGAFGVVYKGRWRNTDCVVKQLDLNRSDEKSIQLFMREATNVQNIGNHPNVCTVFGVCTNPEHPICIVMELVAGGSLEDLMYNEKLKVDAKTAIEFGMCVASGMSHLHQQNLLHCDLAARNLLVSQHDGKYMLKITDFGLSKVTKTDTYNASHSTTFPIKWTAPETLRGHMVSRASDVWSFGVVLWEMIECKMPYPDMNNADVITQVCDHGYRLPKPQRTQIPDELYQLMKSCWASNPEDRPSFNNIYKELEDLYTKSYGQSEMQIIKPESIGTALTNYSTNYQTNNGTSLVRPTTYTGSSQYGSNYQTPSTQGPNIVVYNSNL